MRSDEMYYAAFSAALMAGTEPGIAQQLAYQLAYIHLTSPADKAFKDESEPFHQPESIQKQAVRIRPINPLNHVDWLKGGTLNERGMQLGRLCAPSPVQTVRQPQKTLGGVKQPAADQQTEKHQHKINQAIMLALMDSDSNAQNKFVAALYFYWRASKIHICKSTKASYWLLMHAIRCYLFGTTFQWDESFINSTDERQQKKPMYPTVKELIEHLNFNREESHLLHALSEQMSYYPCNQQIQCIELGLAYRAEVISDLELANVHHQQSLNLDGMQDAALWAMKS
ncbi:conserved hypothetical protein [Vibrio nigripulchritudo SOn1]|uniref:Uncharacterized protein n=1 Tax=Vibrio nigripulchritudo SOn1 TaxID=1238450 RepID=A0AAV2VNM2_9VIBR|nr:hypothetical protein [Vibrio nigripulchritudo]CCO46344.1 conserved hypothetical protein [Vibrio nigripulchritudo SOn1]